MRILILSFIYSLFTALTAMAQSPVPDHRFVTIKGVDYYGADLESLFDTDLNSCARACSGNARCVGFTFNKKANSCFPKSGLERSERYEEAVSGRKLLTDLSTRTTAKSRVAEADFLTKEDLDRAVEQARTLGVRYAAGDYDLQTLMDTVQNRRSSGNLRAAASWQAAIVSLTDDASHWEEYANLLLSIKTDSRSQKRRNAHEAISASINAYLRSKSDPTQATALLTLSRAFEGYGYQEKQMIPALRLALDRQPRHDIESALNNAIQKYGFRVVETEVESDSAAPRICAVFSEPLNEGIDAYDAYVRRTAPGLVVQADGRKLCIDGVEHGIEYTLTLREGMPAASGEVLYKNIEITQYVRDRGPSVRFSGRAYVLPRGQDVGLPVDTVNVSRLDLELRRVSDRNLINTIQNGQFGKPISHYEIRDFNATTSEFVWKGSAEIAQTLNAELTTRLPLDQALAGQPAGVYTLRATHPGADNNDGDAMQWFVLSDLGLSAAQGSDGLLVTVLGLGDAQPKSGVELTLLSRANAVLGTTQTDASGFGQFDAGLTKGLDSAAPGLVLARMGDQDLGFLSLTGPAFDLSDRGVEGRAAAGAVDVFATTDRGAYRPGETVNTTVLARDGVSAAIEGLPLIAVLRRPDGVEYARQISDGAQAGGHVFTTPLGATAPRGTWKMAIYADPDAPALSTKSFLVEDFLPERIDFDQSLISGDLRLNQTPSLEIEAKYLFGAPGAGLKIDGEIALRREREVEGWPGFEFGQHSASRRAVKSYFSGGTTDASGRAQLSPTLPEITAEGNPLAATIVTRIADGAARPVERVLEVPVVQDTPLIGIRPLFEDVVPSGDDAKFEIVLVEGGKAQAENLRWTLNRINTRYQWYSLYGGWDWEAITTRSRVASGDIATASDPARLTMPLEWGEYELLVETTQGTYARASTGFYAGWYGTGKDGIPTPDRLTVSLDEPDYAVGDTARLRIEARLASTALVTVLSNKVIDRQVLDLPAGQSTIPLEITPDWGAGAYVTVSLLHPMNEADRRNPARSLGMAHAKINPGDKQLAVAIDAPELARPRAPLKVGVAIDGAKPGEIVWMTVAAVDQGILNMTGFQSPDPSGHYFGQRRLGVDLRDVYGQLIDGLNGAKGTVRSGGDDAVGSGFDSPPPTQDLLSEFSGPVQIGANGRAEVEFPIPPFNGTVRLMAVAWSPTAVGQADAEVIVRDPVVVSASVPRFLAPGDTSRIRLDLTHADGPSGKMGLRVLAGLGLQLGQGPDQITLDEGGKATLFYPVTALSDGDPEVIVRLTTPDGKELTQTLRLPVRSNDPPVAHTQRLSLAAGKSLTLGQDVFDGFRPGTGEAILSAGPLARFDVPGLLSRLDRYPYGCTEQVTSKALPLLYLSSVAEQAGYGVGKDIDARIKDAIVTILSRQAGSGSFGLWRAASGDLWLDAYVSDFLSRARAQGHDVPDTAFRIAMNNLRNRVNYAPDFDEGGEALAYALMVLAREGAAAIGDLRYYADAKGEAFTTPLGAAQLGAALASYGDQPRADAMFARASAIINQPQGLEPKYWRADYGTRLRDTAGVLALAVDAGSTAVNTEALARRVSEGTPHPSTQESVWSLLAAKALIDTPESSGLLLNGAPVSGAYVQVLEHDTLQTPMTVAASDGGTVWLTLSRQGVPEVPPAADGVGYSIKRAYYAMDGTPLDIQNTSVGDRFVAVLTVESFERQDARLMINDPLPAGFEIDNPSLLRSGDISALDWLEPYAARHSEFRSDRFLAAVDGRGDRFQLAYILRAVSPGEFHHPAAMVEDMYRPDQRAWTDAGRVRIAE